MRNKARMLTAVVALAAPLVLWMLNPEIEAGRSICPTWNMFGVQCPCCGLTRSFIAMYQGRVGDSLGYNLFGPLLMAVLLVIAIVDASGKRWAVSIVDRLNYSRTLWTVVIIVACVYGVVRNF